MRRRDRAWQLGLFAVITLARSAQAAGLGIPLDGFLTTFLTWVTGLGLLIGTIGLAGWIASMFDNPFSTLLSGSVGYFTKAGLLGGGTAILPLLGLVGGATV
jgi:hypothetical protein